MDKLQAYRTALEALTFLRTSLVGFFSPEEMAFIMELYSKVSDENYKVLHDFGFDFPKKN